MFLEAQIGVVKMFIPPRYPTRVANIVQPRRSKNWTKWEINLASFMLQSGVAKKLVAETLQRSHGFEFPKF